MQTNVRVYRKPGNPKDSASLLTTLPVQLPPGVTDTSDAARKLVRDAAAKYGSEAAAKVLINHLVGGGFVAYLPPLPPARKSP